MTLFSTPTSLPVHVVLLVSEQLTPALEFVLHAAHRWGRQLAAVHLYCTHDARRSEEPANRLRHSLQRWMRARGLTARVEKVKGGMQPHEVRQGLMRCFNHAPDAHWLVNVTGGNKLMSASAIELSLATDLTSCRVIYKEITGQWLELRLDETPLLRTEVLDAQTDPDVPPVQTLDTLLPLEELVAVQFSEQHHQTSQVVKPLPLLNVLHAVQGRHWDWRELYRVAAEAKVVGSGDGFERFIAAGLQACGVGVRHSLKVHDTAASNKVVREIDVVACHHGRLVCIDIKLPAAEDNAKGTQLADIADLARQLGGSAAVPIALRPGWKADKETSRLAQALSVRLLTQDDAPRVFSQLLRLIDPQRVPTPEVQAVEQQLQVWAAQGYPVLSDSRRLVATHALDEEGLLSVSSLLVDIAHRQQRIWALAHLPSGDVVLWVNKNPTSYGPAWNTVLENRLLSRLRGWGEARQVLSNTKASFSALVYQAKPKAIEVELRQLLGAGLLHQPSQIASL